MGEFLRSLLGSGILSVAALLTTLGLILKYRTGTSNELIACVLLITSLITWSIIALIERGAAAGLFYILYERAFCYGGFSWFIAISGWDLGHGLYRYFRDKKKASGT